MLRTGATTEQITMAEQQLGLTLPEEVKDFYACYDGCDPNDVDSVAPPFAVCTFIKLLGQVDSLVSETNIMNDHFEPVEGAPTDGKLITFAKDFAGNSLLIQCLPSDIAIWRFDPSNGVIFLKIASSLSEFLEKEAQYLKEGKYIDYLINYDDDYRYLDTD